MDTDVDGPADGVTASPAEQLEKSRQELLDLSLKNLLLSFRPLKAKGVSVVGEFAWNIFRALVDEKKSMYFKPSDVSDDDDGTLLPTRDLLVPSTAPADTRPRTGRSNQLQTPHGRAQLDRRLLNTLRHAKMSIEEQGVNILYLALGMLEWYESESSDAVHQAPLVLVPVSLDRAKRFKLKWTEEDLRPNISLAFKLKRDFNIQLPRFDDGDDLDVARYLRLVSEAVSHEARWTVNEQSVHLGFFIFSKLLMYEDLDPSRWPDHEAPAAHSVVKVLYGSDGFAEDRSSVIPKGDNLDDHPIVADIHNVTDSDSSQNLAIADAMAGRNLVVQGPPGTGKSQMITNLIAEALASGKKVLFVAEKLAALEVVKRRLDSVGLGDACLELHSHKANKRAVLNELRRTMELDELPLDDLAGSREMLAERRKRLNNYCRAINDAVGESGFSPNKLIGMLARDDNKMDGAPVIEVPDAASWDRQRFEMAKGIVQEVQDLAAGVGVFCRQVYWGSRRREHLDDDVEIGDRLTAVAKALSRHQTDTAALCGVAGLEVEVPTGASEVTDFLRAVQRALQAPDLSEVDHGSSAWTAESERVEEIVAKLCELTNLRAQYDEDLILDVWGADLGDCRSVLAANHDKWSRIVKWKYLKARFELHRYYKNDSFWSRAVNILRDKLHVERGRAPGGTRALDVVKDILEAQQLRSSLEEADDLIAALFPDFRWSRPATGDAERWKALCTRAKWLLSVHQDVEDGVLSPVVLQFLGGLADRHALKAKAAACGKSARVLAHSLSALSDLLEWDAARYAPQTDPLDGAFPELECWLEDATRRPAALRSVVSFNQIEARLQAEGLEHVAEIAASWPSSDQKLVSLYERCFYQAWRKWAFRKRPVLQEFNGDIHDNIVRQFQQLDKEGLEHNRKLVRKRHRDFVPRGSGGGQLAVLLREIHKKSRHFPLRKLMTKAGNAIQGIKPVFKMSPLAIAKYIPPESLVRFEMVIFDEGSQVRPVDAMGAIIRGKHTVVVGDSKQLPPTSFFDRIADDDDDNEPSATADIESVLDLFSVNGAPKRMLRWHYRSRDDSLIAVSNHEFYEYKLVVFPSPEQGRKDTGVIFRHDPKAHYRPGKGRGGGVNPGEAQTVAQAVIEHAATQPKWTLGVAAFSLAQARRIEDEVESLRRQDPSMEEFFDLHPHEPFFVKNLENVQGDERDVILISVGYGKTADGTFRMNFGPLNKVGGERRLNVLITRARRRCVVHCNFVADDLDLRRSKADGVIALKTYLKYAETGQLDVPKETGLDADSPFEEAVAAALRSRGHDVEHQVGSASYRIDLAVVDPQRPGRYLLGIECDGAAYHSARSARDRDRLRQQVLEGLGWTIHRIWSTDWFHDPNREIEKAEEAIRSVARSNGDTEPPGDRSGATVEGEPVGQEGAASGGTVPLLERRPSRVEDRETRVAAEPYRLAQPEVDLGGCALEEAPLDSMLDWILEVVKVESPVHLDEAVARVAHAAGEWARKRVRRRVVKAVKLGVNDGRLVWKGDFLWQPGETQAPARSRDKLPAKGHKLRSAERTAGEEIETALRQVIKDSYGISCDEAVAVACKVMGLRRTPKIGERFTEVLDALVRTGAVESRGAFVHLAAEGS